MAKSGRSSRKRRAASNRGFGEPKPTSAQDATQFMRAVRQAIADAKGDKEKVYRFFEANLDSLDESLLEALPAVFAKVTANERQGNREKVAARFLNFSVLVQDFPLGERALNIELAITIYQLALRVFLRKKSPEPWAAVQNNLGSAYCDRIRGERAENLENAIAAFELALQVRTYESFPEDWAATQNNLGIAYCRRIRGERAENLENAIVACELALQVRTYESFPVSWAATQNSLGGINCRRIRGERAENLENAIAAFELALQVCTYESFPEDWAATQNNLGNAYRERIRGERAENLENAIAAFELALQVRTYESFPEDWAVTQNNLGNAYRERIRGERAENLENAVNAFLSALKVQTRESFPEDWAMAQNNLGYTYHERILGARAENVERAITVLELSLHVRTRESFPENWAETQFNLANAYRDRIQGSSDQNLEKAISLHEQAAEVFTRESFPNKWAQNQSKLAKGLMKKASLYGAPADLDIAIVLLQEATEVATPGSPHCIDAQYELGNALHRRYENSQDPHDLEQALKAYKLALDAISPEHYDRRQMWQALPTTQSILGSRLIRDGEWQEGLQLLLNSVSQLTTGDDPLAHANALYETGRAYDVLSEWDKARTYFRDALRLYEYLKDPLGVAKSRAELGSVLVFQGYTEKGLAELAKAKEDYSQLQQLERLAEVDILYKATQQVLEQQNAKAYA